MKLLPGIVQKLRTKHSNCNIGRGDDIEGSILKIVNEKIYKNYIAWLQTTFTYGYIHSAKIYLNVDYANISQNRRDNLLRHEFGHVLGLGHPSDITISIMRRYNNSSIINPQNHDRNDLLAFYPNH